MFASACTTPTVAIPNSRARLWLPSLKIVTPPPSTFIHILCDNTLTAANRDKFNQLAGRCGQRVSFHNVEEICADEITFLRERLADKIKSRFSVGAFYRLLVKKIFGAGKMIYLDADIIVNLDLAELWRHDLSNFPLAAVPEISATHGQMITDKFLLKTGRVKAEDYFCSGVMMFNLDKLGETFFRDGVQFLADNPACESVDQDILNAFFAADYLKLEQKFDSFVPAERNLGLNVGQKIYHYAGNSVGLNLGDPHDKLWLDNFELTPWFNLDALNNLCGELDNAVDQTLQLTQWLMRIYAERQRAFAIEPSSVAFIKPLFGIRDGEQIIGLRDENSLNELVSKMHEQRGRTTFFIFVPQYALLKQELIRLGFREFDDFADGLLFVTQGQYRRPRPSWNFIRAL